MSINLTLGKLRHDSNQPVTIARDYRATFLRTSFLELVDPATNGPRTSAAVLIYDGVLKSYKMTKNSEQDGVLLQGRSPTLENNVNFHLDWK